MKLKLAAILLFSVQAHAAECNHMTSYNYSTAMCEGRAMPAMPMTMLMVHGNVFAVGDLEEGPRAENKFAAPNMLMGDLGTSIGERNFVNLDVMLTFERWTFPDQGNPLLLQIGEERRDGTPYIDSQHPHSSPIMGLTLSDKFSLGEHDHAKIWFAPRGESTDGPTAFMHRPSGEVNPDAPLGHHIGQDVGHISSTVIGGELRFGQLNFEASTFNGTEPEPQVVDLPMEAPNSYAFRLTHQLNKEIHHMASVAYVKNPEPHDSTDHVWRYSYSIYTDHGGFHDAFVFGLINFYDQAGALQSWLYEAMYKQDAHTVWGRAEAVERTPNELEITRSNDRTTGRWTEALTLGYTHDLAQLDAAELKLGASVTKDFLPIDYRQDYGSNPWSARVFLQLQGMTMSHL